MVYRKIASILATSVSREGSGRVTPARTYNYDGYIIVIGTSSILLDYCQRRNQFISAEYSDFMYEV